MPVGRNPTGRFAPDALSLSYDAPIAAFMAINVASVPESVMNNMPGGVIQREAWVDSTPAPGPDGLEGSDLTAAERAWTRSFYRYMRRNLWWLSARLVWGNYLPGTGRQVTILVSAKTNPRQGTSFVQNPSLRAYNR